jgi:hypothetical protein
MESARSENELADARVRPILSAEWVALLQTALAHGTADRNATSSPPLKDALRQLCSEAKLRNWPPEALLIALKTSLNAVPAVQSLTRGPDRDEFVTRVVSLCINEYYGTSPR